MLNIRINTIPDSEQPYNTVGNYYEKDGVLHITISNMGDWRSEVAIAVHELIESSLCRQRGISFQAVNEFDINFEKNIKKGDLSEPGNEPSAPYHKEHVFALAMEHKVALELGLDWEEHQKNIDALDLTS